MANTENIEARLCAYVDGELDPAGRAEIEAHLAANPQHRQLMDELMKQRALLQALPRERAPEDLFEAMTNQLERSVLLDGDAPPQAVAGQINRWPQIFAAAAVLMLAVGLAAVIYFVLPNQSQRSPYVVLGPTATAPADETFAYTGGAGGAATRSEEQPIALAERGGGDRVEAKDLGARVDEPSVPEPVAVAPAAPPPPPSAAAEATPTDVFAEAGAKAAEVPSHVAALTNVFANQVLNEKLKSTPGVPDDSQLIVVSAENPSAANEQIQQYFARNNIRWEPVVEPMPEPLQLRQDQVVLRSRLPDTQMRLKGGGMKAPAAAANEWAATPALTPAPAQTPAAPEPPAQEVAQARKIDTAGGAVSKLGASAAPDQSPAAAAPAPVAPPTPRDREVAASPPSAVAGDAYTKPGPDAKENAKPADGSSAGLNRDVQAFADGPRFEQAPAIELQQQAGPPGWEFRMEQAAAPPAQEQQQPREFSYDELNATQQQQQQQAAPVAAPQLFIARDLTKQQVSELNAAIALGNRVSVSNFSRAGGEITPTTLPAAQLDFTLQSEPAPAPPTPTEPRSDKAEEKVLGRSQAESESATTAPAQLPPQRGAISGIAEPDLDAPATFPAGRALMVEQGAQQPGSAAPAPAAPAPTTLPAGPASLPSVAATGWAAAAVTQPSEISTAAAAPAIQPFPADAEERVDVVILVQPETDAALGPDGALDAGAPEEAPAASATQAVTTAPATAPAAR